MTKNLLLFILLFIHFAAFSQQKKKECVCTRCLHAPKIDGDLGDSAWKNAPVATDFIQSAPNPGQPSRLRTEVRMLYDNTAIYVSAMMYDPHPDSILHELSKRDNVFYGPNADAFGITLDPYCTGQNAVLFGVTAAGVQTDTKIANDDFDDSWNVAWESSVRITGDGWTAEMKIPYSAIRFPKKEVQQWGVNFARMIRRYREMSHWNPIDPKVHGFVRQSGLLNGIEKIEAPLRLSLSPYLSAYEDFYDGKSSFLFNGGADVKYGINESFTLDMTLIPDFGQVRSDDKVLNLTPFEIRYDEKRSFFTEGTELFQRANIFYSRRVGGAPLGYDAVYDSLRTNETVTKDPASSQLYNATKLSGRTKNNLGIGIFNATTAPTYATLTDTITGASRQVLTQSLTNYNVIVLDQQLKNNSFVSLVNTNVMREGSAYDANVTGTEFKFVDKANKYAVWGQGSVSRLFYPDSSQPYTGELYRLSVGKISGNYTNNFTYRVKSNKYNPNDLGYLERNNERAFFFNQSYNTYEPFWRIVKMSNDLGIDYYMNYTNNSFTNFNIDWNTDIDFRNYFTWGFFWHVQPLTNYDYYQPRVPGRYYAYASNYGYGTYFSSDSRKNFHMEGFIGQSVFNERSRNSVEWALNPRYRFSDKLNLSYSYWRGSDVDDVGFVDFLGDSIIFGVRDRETKINTVEGNYLFTNRMSLTLRVRHYWSQVQYREFFALNAQGKDSPTSYNTNNDINFNAFNVDMAFTWQFAPASEMSVVWKNAILTETSTLLSNYLDDMNKTFASLQRNSFSVKILYYLDYQSLRKKK